MLAHIGGATLLFILRYLPLSYIVTWLSISAGRVVSHGAHGLPVFDQNVFDRSDRLSLN